MKECYIYIYIYEHVPVTFNIQAYFKLIKFKLITFFIDKIIVVTQPNYVSYLKRIGCIKNLYGIKNIVRMCLHASINCGRDITYLK